MQRDGNSWRDRVGWQRATSVVYVVIAAYCGYVLVVTLVAVARR